MGGQYVHVGDHIIPVPYKVRGDHQTPIPYKLWETIRVIDSYKFPIVDSNHEDSSHGQLQVSHSGLLSYRTCGGWHVLAPEDRGL